MTHHKGVSLHLWIGLVLLVVCVVFADSDQILMTLTSFSIFAAIALGCFGYQQHRQVEKMIVLLKRAYVEMPIESHAEFEDLLREDTGLCPNFTIFGLNCDQGLEGFKGGCSACGVGRCKKKVSN